MEILDNSEPFLHWDRNLSELSEDGEIDCVLYTNVSYRLSIRGAWRKRVSDWLNEVSCWKWSPSSLFDEKLIGSKGGMEVWAFVRGTLLSIKKLSLGVLDATCLGCRRLYAPLFFFPRLPSTFSFFLSLSKCLLILCRLYSKCTFMKHPNLLWLEQLQRSSS